MQINPHMISRRFIRLQGEARRIKAIPFLHTLGAHCMAIEGNLINTTNQRTADLSAQRGANP